MMIGMAPTSNAPSPRRRHRFLPPIRPRRCAVAGPLRLDHLPMHMPSQPGETLHVLVGARPVRLVCTADGGLDVEAIDWRTGEMVRAIHYLTRITLDHGADVEEVDAEQFERTVRAIRARL